MTRIHSTLLVLAIAATATTAGAQSTAPGTSQRAEHANSDSAKWKARGDTHHGDKHRGDKHRGDEDRADARDEGHGGRGPGHAAMRGVKPTEAQRAQIRAIHEKYKPQFESLRATMKPAMDEAKAARQRGDTAAARAAFAKTAASREQAQVLRTQEHAEIRAILTPAQQQTFDANVAREKNRDRMHDGHGRRGRNK